MFGYSLPTYGSIKGKDSGINLEQRLALDVNRVSSPACGWLTAGTQQLFLLAT